MSRRSAIVVGAGIVGAACAEALAEAGLAVDVIDAARPGGGATAAGMGHILVLDDSEPQLELTRLSRELWDARDWPQSVERDPCGTLWVAADEAELDVVGAKHAWFAERGIESEVVDGRRVAELEPNLRPGLAGGLRFPGDSVVYPPAATRHLLDRAAASGATIREGVRATHVHGGRDGGAAVALEGGGRLDADFAVVAAGVATRDLVDAFGLDVSPKKGHLAITDRVPGFIRHQLIELGYLASAHGSDDTSVAFNAQPRATGQVLLGSSRQLDTSDPNVEPDVLARMIERGLEYLPGLKDLPVVRTWVGFRPATPDNLPVIGPVFGSPGLVLATGHEGVGITTSLGTARLVAAYVSGSAPPIDPRPFDLERVQEGTHA